MKNRVVRVTLEFVKDGNVTNRAKSNIGTEDIDILYQEGDPNYTGIFWDVLGLNVLEAYYEHEATEVLHLPSVLADLQSYGRSEGLGEFVVKHDIQALWDFKVDTYDNRPVHILKTSPSPPKFIPEDDNDIIV